MLVVNDVQRLANERVPVELSVDFNAAEIEALVARRAALRLDHLAHPLACGVIHVIRLSASTQIHLPHLVLEVPSHLHAVDGGHAAMRVAALHIAVGIYLDLIEAVAHGGSRQTIALFRRLDEAVFVVLVAASPTAA